jgi:multicomponent Na+:H+ antiporter subunit F
VLSTLTWALAVATVLSLYRVMRGPTVADRLAGLGVLATKTILLLLFMGFLTDALDAFVDVALSYGLINFLGLLALARYFELKQERP